MIIDPLFPIKGKLDGLRIWRSGNKTVAAVIKKDAKNPRTEGQMRQRIRMNNILSVYRSINTGLKENFEGIMGSKNASSFFRSYNLMRKPVWLTYRQKLYNQGVLAPYVVGQGKLPTIAYDFVEGAFVSDLAIGDLNVGPDTTVKELAQAVCGGNEGWAAGDTLQVMLLKQRSNCSLGDSTHDDADELWPIQSHILTLTLLPGCKDRLAQLTPHEMAFPLEEMPAIANREGHLAVEVSGGDEYVYAFALVHGRGEGEKRLCSSQELVLSDTRMYETYTSDEALERALTGYKPKRR